MTNPLHLHNVSKRYGTTMAVSALDLSVPAGSRTAIVGPSGSGKTTLLRLIAGFEAPEQGTITLGDTVLADGAMAVPAYRRGIGYVAQEGALFPHLTVAANIGFGIDRHVPQREARIEGLMQQVGLSASMRERRPHQLSGGQQQRVALARALAREPRLMLLDEPFSALDTGLREAMRDMVAEVLSSVGVTTILVTHDQQEALSFSDFLAVMHDGRVVQAGTPQQLYRTPADVRTARFLGNAIILQASFADGVARTVLGAIPIAASGRTGNGTVMLRPEQLRLTAMGEGPRPATGSLARILNRTFGGATWRVSVEHLPMADGYDAPLETSTVFSMDTSDLDGATIGDIVHIRIVGSAVVLA